MLPRKQPPAPSPQSQDDRLDRLTEVIEALAQEVRVLREAIDEFREIFTWATNNREPVAQLPSCFPITSIPKDPLDPHFGEKINRIKPDDLPDDVLSPPTPKETLFD